MPNLVPLSTQMKTLSIQAFDSDRSVCMVAICYSGPISMVTANEKLLVEKVGRWRDRQTHTSKDSARHADHLYIIF